MNDLISFYQNDDGDQEQEEQEEVESWKILIVDDDESIHQVTRLALSWVVLDDKPLEFISAYSGEEAKRKFQEHDDIALVLLDVVMETNKAGFEVANYIRHDLNNFLTRIVLRTGQPGDVPEREVILNYEIDGYKTKSELTAQALFSMILTSLRSYRDLRSVEDNNKNLEKIVQATSHIFEQSSMTEFVECLLGHLCDLLPFIHKQHEELYYFAADFKNGRLSYINGAQSIDYQPNEELFQHLLPDVSSLLIEAHNKHSCIYRDGQLAIASSGRFEQSLILYFADVKPLNQSFEHLLDVFRHNFETAYENLLLNIENEKHSKELAKCLDERTSELSQTREKLFNAEKLSIIGRLAISIAHEINNPLGLIKNNFAQIHTRLKPLWELLDVLEKISHSDSTEQLQQVEWLSHEVDFGQLREKLPQMIFATDGDVERICNIVDILHHFSKLESSNLHRMDLKPILQSSLDALPLSLTKNIEIISDYAETPLVDVMPEQFAEALTHIFLNALEEIDENGTLRITSSFEGEQVKIAIRDSGRGIDAQIQKRIFEPFFSNKGSGHTGLGLYLAQSIIKLHNGEILLQSEPGQGSIFVISLTIEQE